MVMRLGSRKFGWLFRLTRLWLASSLFIMSIPHSSALAQSSDNPWAVPLNLSHSGVARNPTIVIDSDAVVHAVWQDEISNFVYTRLDDDQWSEPETTDLNRLFQLPIPGEASDRSQVEIYTGLNPLFIAGPGPHIFAFWISPQRKLFTSKVRNLNFGHFAAWDSGAVIASGAASFAVAVDARGDWHLVYLQTADDPKHPAGIYYTRSKNSGWSWAVPMLLYESPYLRSLDKGEANLSISTVELEDALRVFIAWDNRPRKQVFLAQSADGGASWEQPALIAGPEPDSGLASPFGIHVGTNQDSVVLVWQTTRPDGACAQIYQSSNDMGATWSEPQPMNEALLGCAQSPEFVAELAHSPEGPLYFLTETESQIYLSAWNGLQWGEPQQQPILAGFEDPEIFTQVDYGCHRASLLEKRLYIIGCDEAEGGDVWVTSRDLELDASWFRPPVWSQLSPVTSDNLEIEAVELVATDDGLIHAFFSQHQDRSIYHMYWDGELWSHITPVMELPDGEAGRPAIAEGPGDELFLIARNNSGALYFSKATSSSADVASSWSTPIQLGTGHNGANGSVDIACDAAGNVYILYSVPVSDERGIYLVLSKDHGTTWSEPLQVFDGVAAGFDIVGPPSVLTSANDLVHVVWKEQSIQGDGALQPLSLYYTRSEDGGRTFNDAEMLVEEAVAWREIVTDSKGHLHLLWQPQDTLTTVWDQVSLDGGHTWQYPQGLPDEGGLAAVTRDPAGRLHFVGVGLGALGHWLWDGSRWQSEASLSWLWTSQQKGPVELLAAAVNRQGKMMVVLAERTGESEVAERTLLYSTRALELPQKQTAIQEVPTTTQSSPTITPVTVTPELLLTPTGSVDNQTASRDQMDHVETNDAISPWIIALLPVALLLLSVLGLMIRRAARVKDR
jgi:hypothetical protein